MTKNEFLSAVLDSEICPKNFSEIYQEFNQYQDATMDTLQEFHRICEKYRIPYQLAFGSLLGAVRDNGQLPWDYDIDVLVPQGDRARLIQALKEDLNNKYYFNCVEVNRQCRHMIMRLAPIEYNTVALHVDVFFVVGTPMDSVECKDFRNTLQKYSQTRYYRMVKISDEWNGNFLKASKIVVNKVLSVFQNVDKQFEVYDALCKRYSTDKSEYWVLADGYATRWKWKGNWLIDTMPYVTAEGEFRIPIHYEDILTEIYGDYLQTPPLKNCVQEMMGFYKRLKKLAQIPR